MPALSSHNLTRRRPILVTLIISVFGLWILLGWLRFAQVLIRRELILEILSTGLFWYFLLAGVLWGLAGLPVLWGLLRRRNWAFPVLWIAGGIYPAMYWVERLFLWRDQSAAENWPFMLVLTILWLGLVAWASISTKVRQYLNQDLEEDRKSP
jgi:hypothetical protein